MVTRRQIDLLVLDDIKQPEGPVTFTKVGYPNGWLGNMAPYAIVDGGLTYRTAEALFQSARFGNGESLQLLREVIRAAASPMTAKMIAKRNIRFMAHPVRSEQDIDIMRRVLRLKIEQHPGLRTLLLETGERDIIEDVTRRDHGDSARFWGAAMVDGWWQGSNHLGRLWMELRETARTT